MGQSGGIKCCEWVIFVLVSRSYYSISAMRRCKPSSILCVMSCNMVYDKFDIETERFESRDSDIATGNVGTWEMSIGIRPLRSNTLKAGSAVVSYISTPMATWTCLVMLLSVHLATNYAAVKTVSLRSLNRQRANVVLTNLFDGKEAPTPESASLQERIFEWDGILRWRGSALLGKARIGIALQDMLSTLAPPHLVTGAIRDRDSIFQNLIRIHQDEGFLLWYCHPQRTALIVLKEEVSNKAQLKAWAVGLSVAHRLMNTDATSAATDKVLQTIATALMDISGKWDDYIERIVAAGWDIDIANLETSSGTRIDIKISQ